jgi:succinyl-CoA synthetase beta subunit
MMETIEWTGDNFEEVQEFLRPLATVFIYDQSCLVINPLVPTERQLSAHLGRVIVKQNGKLSVQS